MMTLKLIQSMYLFVVVAGLVVLVILFYLRFLTNRAFKVQLRMVDANRECNYDLALFLPKVRNLVKTTEIEDIFYDINYGESTLIEHGPRTKRTIVRKVTRPDYSISLGIVPLSPRGYQKYIYMIIFETLFLLIEMDILMKIKVANEALYNFSKLQAFLLHDVKNVTQFIKGLLYNIARITGGEREHRFIQYLKESAPALAVRTDKILATLEIGSEKEEDADRQEIDVARLTKDLFALYDIRGEATGAGTVYTQKHNLVTIFDNIIKNIREKSTAEPGIKCFAYVRENEGTVTVIIYDTGSPIQNVERMFEPFYTTKKSGLGIGLFQAKHVVKKLGGTMTVANTERGVEFTIKLPKGLEVVELEPAVQAASSLN
ncbi:MAG: HAMP domain-containing sensor histidine kinase [Syntrophorhabdus sp.]